MTDKEKIRAEIERLHEEYRGKKGDADVRRALRTVLFFIDCMQEEPVSEDLEEEIDAEWNCYSKDGDVGCINKFSFILIARHFANWQKHQDDLIIKQAKTYYRLLGKQQMKEEMMKGSFNGSVAKSGRAPYHLCVSAEIPKRCEVAFGDKVKVIIIKED